MRRLALIALISCLFYGFAALPAHAGRHKTVCQCMPAPLKKRWADSGAVFTGRVTAITEVKDFIQRGNADIPVVVTVEVTEGLKGVEKGNIFRFHTNQHKDTCMGADYVQDKDYLFFAYERTPDVYERWSLYEFPSGTYDVGGLCGGTARLSKAETIKELGALRDMPPSTAALLKPDKDGIIGMPPDKKKKKPEGEGGEAAESAEGGEAGEAPKPEGE
jgi:hypothetical protein